MKKFIIAFTAIVTMMLYIASPLFIIPLKGHAEGVYVSKENLRSDIGDYAHYIYVCGTMNNNYYSWVCVFNSYNEETAIVSSDRICIDDIKRVGSLGGASSFKYAPISNPTAYSSGGDETNRCDWNMQSTTQRYSNNYTWSNFTIEILESDLLPHDLSEDISVIFNPTLVGSVDRKINGNVSETFSMEVTNNSRFGIQYLMCIVPHGETAQFYDSLVNNDTDVSSVLIGNQYNFVFWRDEPNYNYDSTIQTTFAHAHHPVASETFTAVKQLSPSPWHYLAPDGIDRQQFNWSQINLEKLGSYDVYVYAMRNDYGYASRQAAFSDGDYYVDYSTIETVYYSNFVLLNGYKYDDTDQSHGVYRYKNTGDALNLGLSSSGTYDNNGNFNFEMRDMEDFDNKHVEKMSDYTEAYIKQTWNGGAITNSSGDVPKSLSNSFTNFMKFINWAFSKFPSDIQYIFLYGFVAVVALGIILKVVR